MTNSNRSPCFIKFVSIKLRTVVNLQNYLTKIIPEHIFFKYKLLSSKTAVMISAKLFSLGVDHLIFDGGVVEIPKKISSMCFWLKKNIMQNS